MSASLSVGVFGASGRMGKELIAAAIDTKHVELFEAFVRKGSPSVGTDAGILAGIGETGKSIKVFDSTSQTQADVMIDFTLPSGMEKHLHWCVQNKKAVVIGTTGLNQSQLALIDQAAGNIPIVFAANFSVGINLTMKLLEIASKVIGNNSDIEIIEAHHRFKKDAPSGTALALGQVVADTLGRELSEVAEYGREGVSGVRDPSTIGFSTIRAGDIVGEHTVMFADIGEQLEITHKATSRSTFAKGAIRAAQWLKDKPAGLYSMQNVLDL